MIVRRKDGQGQETSVLRAWPNILLPNCIETMLPMLATGLQCARLMSRDYSIQENLALGAVTRPPAHGTAPTT